jgi:hypothetical protein
LGCKKTIATFTTIMTSMTTITFVEPNTIANPTTRGQSCDDHTLESFVFQKIKKRGEKNEQKKKEFAT